MAMARPFQNSDLDACVKLYVAIFEQPPWNEVWERAVVRERLEQMLATPGFFGVVATEQEGVTGFAMGVSEPWHEGYHFHLKEMCIESSRQRQGLGRRLLEYLADELAERDVKRIYLLTARGDMSEAFYQKAGFHTSPKMILMARKMRQDDVAGA